MCKSKVKLVVIIQFKKFKIIDSMDLGGSGDLQVLVRCCMWVVLDIVIIAAMVSSVAVGACNS